MGNRAGKPIQESARSVLAKKQVPTPQVLKIPHVDPAIPKKEPLSPPTSSSFAENTSKFAPSPQSTQPDNNALSPDILAQISKWQVVKKEKGKVLNDVNREKTTSEIRYYKDRDFDQSQAKGNITKNRVTEIQLHNFYRAARDNPTVSIEVIANDFNLSPVVAMTLLKAARMPHIMKDPEDPELSVAE